MIRNQARCISQPNNKSHKFKLNEVSFAAFSINKNKLSHISKFLLHNSFAYYGLAVWLFIY